MFDFVKKYLPFAYCHLLFLKIYFSYENCTFQTFKSNHYTTLRH
ncbi:hypothetical protein HPHPH11_0884 [Helicobacter pylori Hp H-11]|nr:hypothetical protein HPHPH11_0884 [Helicobacter pylori Hp H-11]